MFKIFIFALIYQYAIYHISVLTPLISQFQSSVISVNFRELKFKDEGRVLSTSLWSLAAFRRDTIATHAKWVELFVLNLICWLGRIMVVSFYHLGCLLPFRQG